MLQWTKTKLESADQHSTKSVLSHADRLYPWYNVMKTALYLCSLSLKFHNLSPVITIASDKSQLGNILQIHDQYSSKFLMLSKIKKASRNDQSQTRSKEKWQLNVIRYPEIDNWKRKKDIRGLLGGSINWGFDSWL